MPDMQVMRRTRAHGEGSLYRRKDGRWVAQLTLQGKQLYKYFRTKPQARMWIQETKNQVRGGLCLEDMRMTVGQFLHIWLEAHRSSVRPKTFAQYAQIVHQYLCPGIGQTRLRDLTPGRIQAFYGLHLSGGKTERTVLLLHSVLHSALTQAVRWSLISRNPAEAVTHPRIRRKELQTLTDQQVRSLLNQVHASRYEALFLVAVTAGLREGEILGLKWSDLDLTTGRLMIQRQLQRLQGAGLVFSEPKSRAGKRVVVLGSETLARLQSHRLLQRREKLLAGSNWHENDLIFPSSIGTPSEPRNIYRRFKMALKNAGLPDLRFHDLRHTAATLMLQQGIHPKIVQERLGHASIMLTLNTYSHVLPSIQAEAAQKMDNLLMPLEGGA
jgi:integrase